MKQVIVLSAALAAALMTSASGARTPRIPLPDEIRETARTYQGACAYFPNLAWVTPFIMDIDYEGSSDWPPAGGVYFEIRISVENDSAVQAPESRLSYSAEFWSASGVPADKIAGDVEIAAIPPESAEDAVVSVSTESVAKLINDDGALSGTLVFRATADQDREVSECNEADNASAPLSYEFLSPEIFPPKDPEKRRKKSRRSE